MPAPLRRLEVRGREEVPRPGGYKTPFSSSICQSSVVRNASDDRSRAAGRLNHSAMMTLENRP